MAAGISGTILASADGTSWSSVTSPVGDLIEAVTYGNGRYLSITSGIILTSSDGTSWSTNLSGPTANIYGLVYGNGLFVAAGDKGIITLPSDGTSWTRQSSGILNYIKGVIYDGSRFIGVGNGAILTSNDGAAWVSQSVDENYDLNRVAYGKDSANQDLYVAVGSNGYPNGDQGIIMTSTDRATWSLIHTTQQTALTGPGNVTIANGTATATVDPARLAQELAKTGPNSVIKFAITDPDISNSVFNLTVADLKAIADNKSILQLETPYGIYKLPAVEIDFGGISKQYTGISYKDIKVTVAFSKADGTKAKLDGSKLVGQPVSIKVNLSAGMTIIELDEFTKYVERDLPVPDGSGFTTGVVIEEDGTLRPVPTKAVTINGKKYAAIFSRTNSVYCLVSKTVSFDDLAGHWARNAVNDMASRLIINGAGSNKFAPDRDITRAEFAAIVVRALGLKASGDAGFADVKSGDWYYGAVAAAYKYGIVSGYNDGSFKPNNRITRQEAMVMMARAMKVAGMDTGIASEAAAAELAKFTDGGSFSEWARRDAAAVIRSGLLAGSEGYARPGKNITRAETAVIVRRLLEKAGLI